MQQRAVGDRARQIGRAAAAGRVRDGQAGDAARVVEAHLPNDREVVALAGGAHVVVAVEPELDRPARPAGEERRDGRELGRLRLLTAEAAPEPPYLDGDGVGRDPEHARHHLLHLCWMLRRREHAHLAALGRDGERHLALEIEVILSARAQAAGQAMRGRRDSRRRVATDKRPRREHVALGGTRVVDREHGWQLVVLDHRGRDRPTRRLGGRRRDREEHLAGENDGVGREDRITRMDGAHVVRARHVGGRHHYDHVRRRPDGRQVEATEPRVRTVGEPDGGGERAPRLGQVVHVAGFAGDVADRAVVASVRDGRLGGWRGCGGILVHPRRVARRFEPEPLHRGVDQPAAVAGARACVADRRQRGVHRGRRGAGSRGSPGPAVERRFRRRHAARPIGEPADGEAHLRHHAALDAQPARHRHRGDVLLEAFGELVDPKTTAGSWPGHANLCDELAAIERRPPRAEEEPVDRQLAPARPALQHERRVQGEKHRREIADRRGSGEIARHRADGADLLGAEAREDLGQIGVLGDERPGRVRQGRGAADHDGIGIDAHAPELRGAARVQDRVESTKLLRHQPADIGRARDEDRVGVACVDVGEVVERRRGEPAPSVVLDLHPVRAGDRRQERDRGPVALTEIRAQPARRLDRRLHDGSIARAPAEIAGERTTRRRHRGRRLGARMGMERHHDAGRAEAAL